MSVASAMESRHDVRPGGTSRDFLVPNAPRETSPNSVSGVSWAAIFGGAAGAAALSLILLILGSGLGFSAVSPWADSGVSASTIAVSTILWLAFTQIVASGAGGYLAGRLRVKWAGVHDDEVYFRDTAHGFLAWAIATLVTAMLLSSAIGGLVKGVAQATSGVASVAAQAGGAAMNGAMSGVAGYAVDSMFRTDTPSAEPGDGAARAEMGRIVANAVQSGELSAADRQYAGRLVAQRTGLAPAEAEKRVADAYARMTASIADTQAKAKQAADTARKNAAYAALWMFVALLAGAFVASLSATFGGRRRDQFA